jgi:predicted permease
VLLLGLTSCVLLVVCLNLASLLLARGQARRKELAIRRALGGGRARIVRQLVTEGLVLAGAGGLLGVLLAAWSTDLLVGTVQTLLPVTLFFEPASPAVFVATTGFCILATFFFALGPALRLSRGDLVRDLGRSAGEDPRESGRSRFLPRHPLVAAQLGLSLGLLIAAGLFVRFVGQAASVHDAFDAEDTLIVEVDGGFAGYDETRGLDSYRRVLERLAALPGVKSAGIAAVAPYGLTDVSKEVQRAGLDTKQPRAFAQWNAVGADYFAALGLPLRRGRAFTTVEAGWSGAPRVAIVDEALARKLWPEGDALGQRIRIARTAEVEIVGIAAASRGAFEKEPRGGVFVPFAQGFTSNAYFHVRPQVQGEASVQALVEPVRRALQAAAPGLPVLEVRSFRQHMRASAGLWALRTSALLFSVFGVLTMLVALVGVYGVQAYAVSRRTREIGIRIALGARPAEVRGLILREGLATALAGVALGLCVGAAVGRLQAAVIVDVRAFDPLAFGMAAALLLGAAALASFLPARRATRIEPLVALRSE